MAALLFGSFLTHQHLLQLLCAILGWLELPALLHLLATPADVYPQAVAYARVMFLGLPAGLILVFLQMSLRGSGDSLTPLLFIIPSSLIDVGLNPSSPWSSIFFCAICRFDCAAANGAIYCPGVIWCCSWCVKAHPWVCK